MELVLADQPIVVYSTRRVSQNLKGACPLRLIAIYVPFSIQSKKLFTASSDKPLDLVAASPTLAFFAAYPLPVGLNMCSWTLEEEKAQGKECLVGGRSG